MNIQNYTAHYTETLTDFFSTIHIKVIHYTWRNSKKFTALTMASKILLIALLLAIMPVNMKSTKAGYNTDIQFDKNQPLSMLSTNDTTKVEIGESKQAQEDRESQPAQLAVEKTENYSNDNAEPEYCDPTEFRPVYQAAASRFGIPWQILEAVHQVESGKSGSTSRSSYAGAQGPMQFMPGTWRAYAVDGNGDGSADANNVVDAIYGAANLLASSGAAEGNIDGALFNYNHAQWYVDKVKTIAYEIGL